MTHRKLFKFIAIIILTVAALSMLLLSVLFVHKISSKDTDKKVIRIIGTSDLHGKLLPFDYDSNAEDRSGSVAQLSTAIKKYYNKDTFLVDVGDSTQGNMADLFLDQRCHPMIEALNTLNYDLGVLGNHEFDYTPDDLDKFISSFKGTVLTGNLYRNDGSSVCDGYKIIKKNGVRVAFIGMTTPNSAGWSEKDKNALKVTDPLEETRKILDKIKGKYDLLVGLYHMDINDEFGIADSGVADICNACPEFDVIVASHGHRKIEGELINGVLVVENQDKAQTMSVLDIELTRKGGGWRVKTKSSKCINIKDYAIDLKIKAEFALNDVEAKNEATSVIGKLEGGPLVPDISEVSVPVADPKTPVTYFEDTPAMELVNRVMMYYADCDVSCNANTNPTIDIEPGDLRKCDIAVIYKYSNDLWKVHMNGAQLKKFMEYNASVYNTYKKGDKGVSITNDPIYNYYVFEGVKYEIDVSEEKGSRIKNLTWPDGKPVKDTDEFDMAVNNYLANTTLLSPGILYNKDDIPTLVEAGIYAEKGGIRNLIIDYIQEKDNGVIQSECDDNWKLIGY